MGGGLSAVEEMGLRRCLSEELLARAVPVKIDDPSLSERKISMERFFSRHSVRRSEVFHFLIFESVSVGQKRDTIQALRDSVEHSASLFSTPVKQRTLVKNSEGPL